MAELYEDVMRRNQFDTGFIYIYIIHTYIYNNKILEFIDCKIYILSSTKYFFVLSTIQLMHYL